AQLAGPPVPKPVPVVVEDVVLERPLGRRALPQGVVEVCRHRDRLAAADAGPDVVVPAPGEQDASDLAGLHDLYCLDVLRPTSPLRALLDNALVLPRRLDEQLALVGVVAAGLL